jgi:hypothetical protein
MGGTAWLKVLEVASAQKIPGKNFKAVMYHSVKFKDQSKHNSYWLHLSKSCG